MECYGNEVKYAEMAKFGFDIDAYNKKLFAELDAKKVLREREEQERLAKVAAKKGLTVEEFKTFEEQKKIAQKVKRYQKELAELEKRMEYLKNFIAENTVN